MAQIASRLWKSDALVRSSSFPQLVRAAASQEDRPYGTGLLEHVAADAALLDAIVLPAGEGMDAALAAMASDPESAAELDDLIVAAVRGHNPEGAQ